ncbi:ABC transporter permease [Rubellimicrobium rubrum]|uniref:Xylose transport system permease protein XylH n=1 Tax=Rubellimicrobium rubrum TaxID=2585369 RepID=A0A5C4MLT3_9RHOB|nr:ABC transporter permease [Rubellimicrobium rubrum]TNC46710.1 ABC transporter permease [Rubellimicrobium rubrum]
MSDTLHRTGAPPATRSARSFSFGALARRPEAGSFLGMVIVFIFFAIAGGANFVTLGGTASWLNVAAEIGIVALPVGLLMIAGELDISIGSVIPAASMTVAIISGYFGLPLILGVAAALALGLLVGFVNGILVIRTGVPSLIVTLGSLFAVAGLTLGLSVIITGSTGVPIQTGPIGKALLGQFIAGIFQVTILWWLVAIVVVGFLLHISRWGNWIFALGGDKVSARNEGIPIDRLIIQLFMSSGFAAAFIGISQAILYNSAQVSTGQSFIFNSIISVVIGGVLLTGGFGSVVGIVFGTITFAIVNQGIFYTGFDANWASLIIGVLLLLAVLLNNTFRKMALNYSPKKGKS